MKVNLDEAVKLNLGNLSETDYNILNQFLVTLRDANQIDNAENPPTFNLGRAKDLTVEVETNSTMSCILVVLFIRHYIGINIAK